MPFATVAPTTLGTAIKYASSGGRLIDIWLPSGAKQRVVLKSFPVFAQKFSITQSPATTRVPHGTFYRLAARPYAGWYVAYNVVTLV